MKKICLLITVLAVSTLSFAQQFVIGSHIKMDDAVNYYKTHIQPYRHNDPDNDQMVNGIKDSRFLRRMEGKDYQFDRWRWYWSHHLDNNGYLISTSKNFDSWMAYQSHLSASRTTSVSGANWVFEGCDSSGASGSGVGRINNVAFHPTDSNTYWIGSPGGGAWKTTDNGDTWTSMTDNLPLLSVTKIVFNPSNPNTVYLCTGDRDGFDYYSMGILKSYDGGTTWNTTGVHWAEYQFHEANDLLINPLDTNSLIFACDSGIYRSFDGGNSWTVVQTGIFMQLMYNPADTNIVYATTQFNYTYNVQSQIYRSADGGMTWDSVTTFTDAERIALAVTPANPAIVKAVVAASQTDASGNTDGLQGIWSSSDTGKTYTQIFTPGTCGGSNRNNLLSENQNGSGCNGQGWYDLCIAMAPYTDTIVYVGGVNAWRSGNGGTTWKTMNQWDSTMRRVATIHGDKHFMGFNPLTPTRFFECNDGGIYYSYTPSSTSIWYNRTNGLGITEFYRVAVSDLATYELAGAQDVGTKQVQNFTYLDADGGDGMECHLDPMDSNTAYSSIYYGYIDQLTPTTVTNISGNIPGAPSGAWVTPFILEPTCHTCIVAGYQDVYRSADEGTTWTDISGALIASTSNLYRVVTTLADSNTFYATEENTVNIFYTHDMGSTTWSSLTAPYSGQSISDVLIDPANVNNLWFAFNGYTDYGSPQVVNYNAATNTWTSFNSNLPDVPINCITIDTQNRTLYVGTETGVFYRDSTMTMWQPFNTGMPVVSVTDLQFDYATNSIWASTFGRSLWSSSRHMPSLGVSSVTKTANAFGIQPNPNHGSFTVSLSNSVKDKNVHVTLIDTKGSVIWQSNTDVTPGNTLRVVTSGIVPGNYIIEVSGTAGLIGREKIIVE